MMTIQTGATPVKDKPYKVHAGKRAHRPQVDVGRLVVVVAVCGRYGRRGLGLLPVAQREGIGRQ